jgi:hypothetical protein
MSTNQEPLIKLEPGGKAPFLSYDIPEPTVYDGTNFIELDFVQGDETPEDYFQPVAFETPEDTRTPVADLEIDALESSVMTAMRSGFTDHKLFPNARPTAGSFRSIASTGTGSVTNGPLASNSEFAKETARAMKNGKRLSTYRTLYGTRTYTFIDEPTEPSPGIYLVESYRLSSFLGNYGAGRIVKTFSLLPGEVTTVSVKTFKKTEEERKSSSSILDSFTEESAEDFESTLQQEQSDKESYAENFEYFAEAEAKAGWGWGSAKVKGGVKGGTNAAREEFSKNVSNSTEKHSMKSSAKREVDIDTSYEVKEESSEETSIERELENINLSRTLNYVFRQMNQEFVTLLTLTDVRVAFFNGFAESREEVTLSELDSLIEKFVVEGKREAVRNQIVEQLENVLDYEDEIHSIVEEKVLSEDDSYLRTRKDLVSVYEDEITGMEVAAPGIILSVMKNVLRTEGVIVEALLGEGEALDEYATQLQGLEVSRRTAEVARGDAGAERAGLVNQLVRDNDVDRARIMGELTCPCGPEGAASEPTVEIADDTESVPPVDE